MAWKTVRTGSSSKSLKSRVAIASSRASAVRTPTCLVTIACLLPEGASPDACSPYLQPERELRTAWELHGMLRRLGGRRGPRPSPICRSNRYLVGGEGRGPGVPENPGPAQQESHIVPG